MQQQFMLESDQAFPPSGDPAATATVFAAISRHAGDSAVPIVLVYFSPLGTMEGWQPAGYFAARYTDMDGDLLDLEYRAYRALVLAVGVTNNVTHLKQAADVLSQPSAPFPPGVPVVPLPTDDTSSDGGKPAATRVPAKSTRSRRKRSK
jgi:hypothetical protein